MSSSSIPEVPVKESSDISKETNPSHLKAIWKILLANPHFVATLVLAIALIPALRAVHQALAFRWNTLITVYWVTFGFQATFVASLFCLIGLPSRFTWRPALERYAANKARLSLLACFLLLLTILFARLASLALVPIGLVVAIALLEFFETSLSDIDGLKAKLIQVLVPAAYLFFGLLLVFAYNDIAVASRPFISYDSLLARADRLLVAGASSAAVAHRIMGSLPPWAVKATEALYYYCMFPQVGGALFLIGLTQGSKQACRFVGTVLMTYYLAVAVFWLWPTFGPFFPSHPGSVVGSAAPLTSIVQGQILAQVRSLYAGVRLGPIGLDYYIAFPSLHVALPIVVAWNLRHCRRLLHCLLVLDLLVLASIFLLEWHYIIDLPGGVVAACVAIRISTREKIPVSNGLATAEGI